MTAPLPAVVSCQGGGVCAGKCKPAPGAPLQCEPSIATGGIAPLSGQSRAQKRKRGANHSAPPISQFSSSQLCAGNISGILDCGPPEGRAARRRRLQGDVIRRRSMGARQSVGLCRKDSLQLPRLASAINSMESVGNGDARACSGQCQARPVGDTHDRNPLFVSGVNNAVGASPGVNRSSFAGRSSHREHG